MKMSRRATRMEKQHNRAKKMPGFNMISLMDIFTILVFFLLVNSSDVEILKSSKDIVLPESISTQKPRESVKILISEKALIVDGRKVITLKQIVKTEGDVIAALSRELKRLASRQRVLKTDKTPDVREVTIMGDKNIPFKVLKKVMATCTGAGYSKISLSVLQKPVSG